MNVAHLLVSQAKQRPDARALIQGQKGSERVMTFAQLDENSARCAQFLLNAGIKVGDHVLVFVPMSIDLYLALIAIFRIGAAATFLDPSAGAAHINRCCEIVKPAAMIALTKAHVLRISCASLRRIPRKFTVGWPIVGTGRWERARDCLPQISIAPRQANDPALVTFTSGSTGIAKGAVRSHGFLAAQHTALCRAIDLQPGEIDLPTLAIFSLANLASGVTSVIPDANLQHPGKIDAQPVLQQIADYQVNRCAASPAFYERLIAMPRAASSLRSMSRIYTGGAPVFPGLMDRLAQLMPQARISAVYGSTEAEPIAEIARSEISAEDQAAMFAGGGLLTGLAVSEINLRIVPDRWGEILSSATQNQFDQQCLMAGQIGEIVVNGPHVLTGYLHGSGNEQTKWLVDGQTWHRTGDAGYLDALGRLWLMGRAEAKIQDQHGTLHPFAVECAASRIEGIYRSAFIFHRKQRWLIVQPLHGFTSEQNASADNSSSGGALQSDKILDQLSWAKIDRIKLIKQIPLDKRHNAKIDYPALRKLMETIQP